MKDHFTHIPVAPVANSEPLAIAREYFGEHREALENTARLLDGERGASRVIAIAGDLQRASDLDRSLRRKLVSLHRLLRLEFLDDSDVVEAAPYVDLDPSSPEVEGICLLTDRLAEMMQDIDACGEAVREAMVDTAFPREAA